MADENYEQLTTKQLIELCKQRECKGYSNLKKAELIELLQTCPDNNCIKTKKLKCKKNGKVCNPVTGRCIKKKSRSRSRSSEKKSRSRSRSSEKKSRSRSKSPEYNPVLEALTLTSGGNENIRPIFSNIMSYLLPPVKFANSEALRRRVRECFYANTQEEYDEKQETIEPKYRNPNYWDVSKVTDMSDLFSNCRYFNEDISDWDVSNVTDMERMFESAESFNQPLNKWDVSSVIDMNSMFESAESFNQPLNRWNVSSVNNMERMFKQAESFNQPLNRWNVGNVNNMSSMFEEATSFNESLKTWNVSSVIDMNSMFADAISFNQPLKKWENDTSTVNNVYDMRYMFANAISFNQPLNTWNVRHDTFMENMFDNARSFDLESLDWYNNNL